jgi:hypothetical protein
MATSRSCITVDAVPNLCPRSFDRLAVWCSTASPGAKQMPGTRLLVLTSFHTVLFTEPHISLAEIVNKLVRNVRANHHALAIQKTAILRQVFEFVRIGMPWRIAGKSTLRRCETTGRRKNRMLRLGFEPRSLPREGNMIGRTTLSERGRTFVRKQAGITIVFSARNGR